MRGSTARPWDGVVLQANINNVVADDVYRVHEQIHSHTHKPAKLKQRKAGEFREVPLPRSVREAMERHEEKHGTTKDGYLLQEPPRGGRCRHPCPQCKTCPGTS